MPANACCQGRARGMRCPIRPWAGPGLMGYGGRMGKTGGAPNGGRDKRGPRTDTTRSATRHFSPWHPPRERCFPATGSAPAPRRPTGSRRRWSLPHRRRQTFQLDRPRLAVQAEGRPVGAASPHHDHARAVRGVESPFRAERAAPSHLAKRAGAPEPWEGHAGRRLQTDPPRQAAHVAAQLRRPGLDAQGGVAESVSGP
jgi:hypothetical protein